MKDKTITVKLMNLTDNRANNDLFKRLMKAEKRMRSMKGWIFALGIGFAVLASELTERKRCENWLKDENNELKARVEELENDVGKLKIDGGAADA